MKYLWVGLILAIVAAAEFLHELSLGDGAAAAVCLAPQTQHGAVREVLLQHLRGH